MMERHIRGPGRYTADHNINPEESVRKDSIKVPQRLIVNDEVFLGAWRPVGSGEKVDPKYIDTVNNIPSVPCALYGPPKSR
jgi:hypothetical protein